MQDATLWIHIFLQMFAFGILFPLGMVLGVSVPDNVQDDMRAGLNSPPYR